MLAMHAHGWHVGPHLLPLLVFEAVEVPDLVTMRANCMGVQAFGIGDQIHILTAQFLKKELGSVGDAALEKPQRERAKDEAVLPAADPAHPNCADGGVHALVHTEVQHDRAFGFPLARVCCDGKGRSEWDLSALDLEHGMLPLAVQVPVFLPWADGVDTGLIDAI